MTPFHATPGGYASKWAIPEIEAFASLALEVAGLIRGATPESESQPQAEDNTETPADAAVLAALDFPTNIEFPADPKKMPVNSIAQHRVADWGNSADIVTSHPILQRLLPSASKTDKFVSEEFRAFTQFDIANTKAAALESFAELLMESAKRRGRVVVPREDAKAVSAAFTDLRLALAQQLSIKNEADAERLEQEAEQWARAAARGRVSTVPSEYQFLVSLYLVGGAAQESLVAAMLAEL